MWPDGTEEFEKPSTTEQSFTLFLDSTGVNTIGGIAVSQLNSDFGWVRTGEAFNVRRTHTRKGIFKLENGKKIWKNMGLDDSHHISQVIVHPGNPDVVWVAAMGHLFTPNTMRGVQNQ